MFQQQQQTMLCSGITATGIACSLGGGGMAASFACMPSTLKKDLDFGTGSRGICGAVRRCDARGPVGCTGDNSIEADFLFGFDAFATRRLLPLRGTVLLCAFGTRRFLPLKESILLCATKRFQELAKS